MQWFDLSAPYFGFDPFIFGLIVIWSLMWKGFALWKAAAHKHSPIWFVILLVVNTFGLLEMLYIFWLSEMKPKHAQKKQLKKKGKKIKPSDLELFS